MDNTVYYMPDEPLRFAGQDIEKLLSFAQSFDVSDITIQTGEAIIAEIYGRLHRITRRKLTNTEVGDIINYIYGPNGTTVMLSGDDIDTNYEFKPNRLSRYRYRVNATGCLIEGHQGIQITLRTIPTDPPHLDAMGLPEEIVQAMAPSDGCVYVTGATGSGKSTLLASIIRNIAEDENANRKILTYESPIEFVYDNVSAPSCVISQSEIPKHLPSFAAGVRNALRRKPRLILVGESRDYETINACLDAALTGHPVYTTVHSNGVAETMRRLVGSFPKEERRGKTIDIIETMRLIIWQKLVPTVDGKRTPLREYLIFDDSMRDKLLNCEPTEVTLKTREILENKGLTMYHDAKIKYDQGLISKEIFNKAARINEGASKDSKTPHEE
ncbi:MAG TPA: Dot/Icm type IV secretion system ATPase DotB [Gammaproteobacteria bacterium]|nr:Dot/Icm type IV secretion system ATPase DotB [Gammaproteobacteria bacterium]